jgi:para-aminobenzoate synthetase/4-amino-4-deoxychorismate lyase
VLRDDFIGNPVVIIQGSRRDYYRFYHLQAVVAAYSPDSILQKLAEIEAAVNEQGLYAAGFVAYEAAPAFDPALKVNGGVEQALPLLWFGLFERRERISGEEVVSWGRESGYVLEEWRPSVSPEEYEQAISHIHSRIAAGDTYQVNYSFRLRAGFQGDPWAFFAELIQAQRPNYAAFIETADFAVCSASPELFFALEDNTLTTRPMKGTAARGLTQTADKEEAEWLQQSTKNRAENVMIVDMIRNDIGRVAEIGSVQVPELFTVERYPTLWQMTSAVTGRSDASIVEIMRALFPCASITGAPKVSTMEIIAELETEPRGLYTGCVGYMAPGRQAQFNVAIRTAVVDKGAKEAVYGVGGGIVWDSVAGNEYLECQVKARILTERRPTFQLLETMLWTPEGGIFLLREHLERLGDSADYFDYPLNLDPLQKQLEEQVKGLSSRRYKIRLLLDERGEVVIERIPLNVEQSTESLHIGMSVEPVKTDNVFLYHKTTNRTVYEQARASRPDCEDVLLWNERGEITEASIANVAFKLDGRLVTPPVQSGLLAGTFRRYLLERGEVEEQVIKLADLSRVEEMYLINSVQEWRRAELVEQLANKSGNYQRPVFTV